MDFSNSESIFGSDDPTIEQEVVIDPSSTPEAAAPVDASADDEAVKAATDSTEADPAAPKEDKPPAPVAAAATQAKKVTFKVGDQDVPLDETAQFEWKVDGKRETITLKDLVTNYAGKIPIERRMSELADLRKKEAARVTEFENVRTRHSSLINDMHERVRKGDTFGAVSNMLEMSGSKQDPAEFIKQLREVLMQEADAFRGMTPEQRQLFEANERNQYLTSKYDRLTKVQQEREAQSAYQQRVEQVIGQHNSSIEEYVRQKTYLEQEYQKRGMPLAQLTPETIGSFIKDARDFATVKDAIAEAHPEAIKDGNVDDKLWDMGVQLLRSNPELTQEDLRDVFREAAALKRSASVSKKVARAPIATVAAAAAKAKAAPATKNQAQRQLMLEQKPEGYGEFTTQDFDW